MTASATVLDAFDTFRFAAEGLRQEDRGTISMRLLREALFDIARIHGMPVDLLLRNGVSPSILHDDESASRSSNTRRSGWPPRSHG